MDEVGVLGTFLESEVVLTPGEPTEFGVWTAQRLMEMLEIHETTLPSDAYIDLLKQERV